MTRKTAIFAMCAALAAAGCGGRSQSAKRADQNYQVVQEGQASGVTSTINGPGETPPPMTDTAIDTTTAFTLPDNPAPLGTQPPGTIAGTFPATPTYPPGYTPAYPAPATPRPRVVAPQPPPMSSSAPAPVHQPPQQAQPQPPPPTDTQVTDEALPPPTNTTTTSTAPPPSEEKPKEEQPKKEGEKTDTSSTTTTSTAPPPPPPPPV